MANDKDIGLNAIVTGTQAFKADMAVLDNVLKNTAAGFVTTAQQLDNSLKKLTDGTTKFDEQIKKVNQAVDTAGKNIKGLGDKASDTDKKTTNLGYQFTRMIGSLTGMSEASVRAGLALGGTALAIDRIIEGGIQGAKVTAVERGFERIVDAAEGSSQKLLDSMRTATDGMISDFSLMQRANILLTGLYEETGKSFVDHMGDLLAIARAQAKLTGQDFNDVFSGLMDGLKRNEFHMLANIGISIRAEEVYARYAASIGKTASQLNAAERQQAALNEVLRIGVSLTQVAGTIQEDAADKYAKFMATLTNITNKLGQMFEPLVRGIYDLANQILTPIKNIIDQVAPYIAAVFAFIGDAFSKLGTLIGGLLNGLHIGELIVGFIKGGAAVIGALATGMVAAFNMFVLPVLDFIAQGIADVLMGHSPPPKGPLHTIDQGGAAVLEAWLQGFMGVSLDPVDEVAAYIQTQMGDIAFFSRDQVNARIKELDDVLNPYIDKLNLLKARFDALKPSTDAAFNAIDRQLMISVKALVKGDEQAAATTRYLDASKDALQGYIDAQQEAIDNQQLQVALVQAQQAEERTLLDIRLRQLGPEEKDKAEKEKKAKEQAGGATVPEASAPFTGFEAGQPAPTSWEQSFNKGVSEIADMFNATGFQGQVDKARAGLSKIGGYFQPKEAAKTLSDKLKEAYGSVNIDDIIGQSSDPNTIAGKAQASMIKAIQKVDPSRITPEVKSVFQLSFNAFKGTDINEQTIIDELMGVFGKAISLEDATKIAQIAAANPDKPIEDALKEYVGQTTTTEITAKFNERMGTALANATAEDIVTAYKQKQAGTFPLDNAIRTIISGTDPKTGVAAVYEFVSKTFSEGFSSLNTVYEGMPDELKAVATTAVQEGIIRDIEKYFADTLSHVDAVTIASLAAANPGVKVTDIIQAYLNSGKDPYATAKVIEQQVSDAINAVKPENITIDPSKKIDIVGNLLGLTTTETPKTENKSNSPFNRVVEVPGGSKKPSGNIASAIQAAIESSLNQDFKDRFASMVSTFVYIDIQGAFNKSLTEIFSPSGQGNVFSKFLMFKDDTQSMIWNVMLFNVDTFIKDVDTRFSQLPMMLVNSALNPMLTFLNSFKNNFVKGINELISALNTLFTNLNVSLGGYGLSPLGNLAPFASPDFNLIGAEFGGLFGKGFLRVGERGPEIIGSAEKIGVLPNALVQQIGAILSTATRVASMPTFAGGRGGSISNTYNSSNSRNMTNNFYGNGNANNVASRLHFMQALGIL